MILDWQLQAKCRGCDAAGAFGSEPEQAVFAVMWCKGCPVREECLRLGLETDSTGVFGGLTRRQRAGLVKRQPTLLPCEKVKRQRIRRPARVDPKCGTTAGYRRHRNAGELTCERCRRAWSEYTIRRRAA